MFSQLAPHRETFAVHFLFLGCQLHPSIEITVGEDDVPWRILVPFWKLEIR
jgi:hypothetical protein